MTPFVIVADLRTGSTLLSTSLNQHPQIRCYGELFHPRDLPDNQIPGHNRYRASGEEIIRNTLAARDIGATGFRAMVFLPLEMQPQWADAWDALRRIDELRVICLTRRNALAQYASVQIAHQTGTYHPPPGDVRLAPENRPMLRVDPEELRRWLHERDELYRRRRGLLEGRPFLDFVYEDLVGDWSEGIRRVQAFLEVPYVPLPPTKQKQETRPLTSVVSNYAQVADYDR